MNRRYTLLVLLVCCLRPSEANASGLVVHSVTDEGTAATISRSVSQITIDGVLDEPDWKAAAPIGEIRQREPHEGQRATESTEVKLLYDSRNLYVGVMCFDSDPKHIIGTQMSRDADLSADDRIEILIDSLRDRRNAFYFATNPLGALVDALVIENGQMINKEWDAIWLVRTRRTEHGWSAEFAIPFKSLGFHRGQQAWGFNFSRTIKRKLEEDRWASPRLDLAFFQVSEAGEIPGVEDIEQGNGLDVRPYVSHKVLRDSNIGNDASSQPGADIFYNITPSLKWTTTINTDFAETEVDTRQINLTRFPLFFPEKRAFFLESAGALNFLNSDEEADVIPFFSRRIGLLEGEEVPMLAGTKLTGKVSGYDVGLLAAHTRATNLVEAKNFLVARVKRNILKQSYVGGIFTRGDPAGSAFSRTSGADFRLFSSRFLGKDQNFGVDGFLLKTWNEGLNGKNNSFGFGIRYPNDLWYLILDWKQIEENFRPTLGFVPRTDVRKLSISAEFNPRPEDFFDVRQMFHLFSFTRFTNLTHNQVESWRVYTSHDIQFNYAPQFERLFEPFEIAQRVTLPVGNYRFTRWGLEISTASKRRWQFDNTWSVGPFWSGHASQLETGFQYKVAPHFQTGITLKQTFARLTEGNFVARVVVLRADYSVSPLLTFFNLVQFDNQGTSLGWQSRVRWTLRPGNDVFLVFTQGWLEDEARSLSFHPTETKLAGKLQYTFRF
ncbi:MAG: hypothetical protein DMG03_02430 [Acidobacteria bacterium]|nr:MAG: hypothetical protein DMG03_02430 [Acidobacteriota bacterium]